MKINIYDGEPNTGKLHKTDAVIEIKSGRWIQTGDTNHPMKFERIHAFENRYVYFLHFFGLDKEPIHGEHIVLNFWQNQRFLFMQREHWIQKNDNVKWLFGILGGAAIGYIIKALTSDC